MLCSSNVQVQDVITVLMRLAMDVKKYVRRFSADQRFMYLDYAVAVGRINFLHENVWAFSGPKRGL